MKKDELQQKLIGFKLHLEAFYALGQLILHYRNLNCLAEEEIYKNTLEELLKFDYEKLNEFHAWTLENMPMLTEDTELFALFSEYCQAELKLKEFNDIWSVYETLGLSEFTRGGR
jgi:hypothetical protein